VGGDRFSQISSAVSAEVAGVANLSAELLGRVSVTARLTERHRMVRAQLEEQRPESDKKQHGVCIVTSRITNLSRTAAKYFGGNLWILVGKSDRRALFFIFFGG
jgi:hypothetical protein